jgi:hypothetical protein
MNKLNKFTKNCSLGLPGGPNEIKVSTEGYRKDSPDVNNPYNVINSSEISMKDVEFPVLGIDEYGEQQMMMPGGEYNFGGHFVTEFPMMKKGGPINQGGNYIYQNGGEQEIVSWRQEWVDQPNNPAGGYWKKVPVYREGGNVNLTKYQNGGDQIPSSKNPIIPEEYISQENPFKTDKKYAAGKPILRNKYGDTNFFDDHHAQYEQNWNNEVQRGTKNAYSYDDEGNIIKSWSPSSESSGFIMNPKRLAAYKQAHDLNKQNRKEGLGYEKIKFNAFYNPEYPRFQSGGEAEDEFIEMELSDEEIADLKAKGYRIEDL